MNQPSDYRTLTTPRGRQLEYFLNLPDNLDSQKEYRTLLALPPGDQTKSEAEAYMHWFEYFKKQAWAMVCPIAPDGKLFFQGSEQYLPYLMDHLQDELNLFGDKFYLLGVSNGGISAFRIATLHPNRFHSITVMPGWPKPADENRMNQITGMPVNFVVGEKDERWRKKSEEFTDALKKIGGDVYFEVVPAEGHMAFHRYPFDKLEKLILRNC